jgi:hypothetical protein
MEYKTFGGFAFREFVDLVLRFWQILRVDSILDLKSFQLVYFEKSFQ